MIESMTGYGRAEATVDGARLEVEVRAVNNRFFDLVMRLPRVLNALEPQLKEVVQGEVSRGRVSVSVSLDEGNDGGAEQIDFDPATAEATIAFLKKMKKRFNLAGEIDVATLVSFPEIVKRRRKTWGEEELWPVTEKLLKKALADFNKMRRAEGKALAKDLKMRLGLLDRELNKIEKRSPLRAKEARDQMRKRVNELLNGESRLSEERLAVEISLLADRLDCTEEVVRFRSHNAQFLDCINEGSAMGKRLNFLLQEMHREANTVGSKANDAEIAKSAIILKEEVEKIREQIQNIE